MSRHPWELEVLNSARIADLHASRADHRGAPAAAAIRLAVGRLLIAAGTRLTGEQTTDIRQGSRRPLSPIGLGR